MAKERRLKLTLITNLGLLLAGAAMASSGFVMQFGPSPHLFLRCF